MNALKKWVLESREQQRRNPKAYLATHKDLVMNDKYVYLNQGKLSELERYCGRYEGTLPTGQYLGKMFLRGDCLMWFSIHKVHPMTHVAFESRQIMMVD